MNLFKLTAFQRDLLFIIASLDQPSGQDIKKKFEDETISEINRGNIYPNLDDLVRSGHLKKESLDRRTNCYILTQQGRHRLQQRHEWEHAQLTAARQRTWALLFDSQFY